jgi:hypothetical protein
MEISAETGNATCLKFFLLLQNVIPKMSETAIQQRILNTNAGKQLS